MDNNKCWCGRKHKGTSHFAWWVGIPNTIRCYSCPYSYADHKCRCGATDIFPIPLSEFF